MSDYYDRDGSPMTLDEWVSCYGDRKDKKRPGPPLIFETMVFPQKDGEVTEWGERYSDRYSTEEQALAGHSQTVASLRAGTLELTVFDGKGSKDRVVPLTSRAKKVIEDMDNRHGLTADDHLWSTRPGGGTQLHRSSPISNTAMQRWWADPTVGVLVRAGVPYRNMHVTRHTFATRLIRRGARLENVQFMMGHSSIQTTVDLYGHIDLNDARADIRLLED